MTLELTWLIIFCVIRLDSNNEQSQHKQSDLFTKLNRGVGVPLG